ncbi:hypothetical protein [Raoultella ornithinolytica]|uniref:hypothetical protein n=1 Tax=Raoultella ornithinolytica TaxID=54291 RepID=UPI000E590F9F|nr:hypothetical protein [Raoultella ornithinolytica]MCF6658291.1 hypothetical protein [Raoultella ornithinolytica]CAE6367609.1 hypothetical protein AI2711V1_3554 [Raoultella ornithinolytica]CAH3630574.1 hypothetical protein AI2711V1_3554 [Raoultella ornithinolytica]
MSDFDMVGHRQVAFFMPLFAAVSKVPAAHFCRGRSQSSGKNHFYCIDLTPFFKIITRYFSAEEGMILTAISYLKMKR